jgi:hypothetical protein
MHALSGGQHERLRDRRARNLQQRFADRIGEESNGAGPGLHRSTPMELGGGMQYTLEMATKMAERLRELPPMDASKRRLDKQGVVRYLAQEITALQERGYTLEQVAESLCGVGLEISTPTLKSYLQRVRSKKVRGRSRPVDPPSTRAPPRPGSGQKQPSMPVKGAEAAPASPRGSTKSEFIVTDRERL